MRVPNSTYLPIGIYYDKDMTYLGSVVRTMSKQTHHKWCWQISAKRRYIKADGSLYSKQELEKIAQKGVW